MYKKIVSSCLCIKQEEIEGPVEYRLILEQIEHLYWIYQGLSQAAETFKQPPLYYQIMIYILPKNGDDLAFLKKKSSFFTWLQKTIRSKFLAETVLNKDLEVPGIEIRDFSDETHCFYSKQEREYIKKNQAVGAILDMMKIKAIIDNRAHQHLQIDSNTQVIDFLELYKITFASKSHQDQFNAIYYANNFIGAHNKVVYLIPDSSFIDALTEKYRDFMSRHHKDSAHKEIQFISPLYTEVFLLAASKLGLVILRNGHWLANTMNPKVAFSYEMTRCIVAAVRRSWNPLNSRTSSNSINLTSDQLLHSLHVRIGDAWVDYESLSYLIKKYTHPCFDEMRMISGEVLLTQACHFEQTGHQQIQVNVQCGKMRGELIYLSHVARDFYIIREAYLGLLKEINDASLPKNDEELCKTGARDKLARLFLGHEVLAQVLLRCPPNTLITNPSAPIALLNSTPISTLARSEEGAQRRVEASDDFGMDISVVKIMNQHSFFSNTSSNLVRKCAERENFAYRN